MKSVLLASACASIALLPLSAAGHGAGGFGAHPMGIGGATLTIPRGTTSGPVTVNNPTSPTPTTTIINNGNVQGGSQPGISITGPTPTTTINNGSITSSTQGVSVSGASSNIQNNGSITVKSTSSGSASATGISQGN